MNAVYHAGFTLIRCSTEFHYAFDMAIWYPSETYALPYVYGDRGIYGRGIVALNGSRAGGVFPVLLMSCGYAGSVYDQAYLAEFLAKQGYIVVSVACPPFEKEGRLGVERMWYRAYELQCALCYLQKYGWQDDIKQGISLLGFSAGGLSVLLLAGAIPCFSQDPEFELRLHTLDRYDFASLREPDIRSLILLAPALGSVLHQDTVEHVTMPTLLMLAECDEVLHRTTDRYIELLPQWMDIIVLNNAGHFVFNGSANPLLKKLNAVGTQDSAAPREEFHPLITQYVLDFLKRYHRV